MLTEYVVRTSLIAAIIALVLFAMRIKTASARHAVWSSVVLMMLLLPAWLAWGPKASLPLLPPEAGKPAITIPVLENPVTTPVQPHSAPAAQRSTWNPAILLLGAYLLGVFILLARLVIGTVRTNRLTSASCVVPVTVGFFRPRILIPECVSEWPRARLDAVLVHEREHARRLDPLVQWIALLNRACFWFHPLSWWLERQLSRLAEEACDAAVLAHGHDPHDYSETLLDLSRSVELAGRRINALEMAMPGTGLPRRIHRMLSGVPMPRISRGRLVSTLAICAAAAAMLASGTLVRAQSAGAKAQPKPVFEVASVKPYNPSASAGRPPVTDRGRFNSTDSLFGFILRAYGIKGCGNGNMQGVDCVLLTGGPAWIHEAVFEIQAKIPDDSSGLPPRINLMLQALLADRFNLKVHRETKQLPVYTLTLGKNGPTPELRKAMDAEQPLLSFPTNGNAIQLIVKNHSVEEVAGSLSSLLGRPVLDQTGLKGKFDFTMDYEADPDSRGYSALVGPSLFAAFQDQLGLKVESTKGPVEVLVIDHAEKPSQN